MTQQEFLDLMTELGARKEGHFKLSSGLHSDTYFQCAQVLQYPDLALELGKEIASKFDANEFDLVVAPAMGALLLGNEVARALGRRYIFTERVDGKMAIRRGFEINDGEKVLMVEDVVTRGTSTLEVIDVIEKAGGVVKGLACLVNRTGGNVELPLPLKSLAAVNVVTWDPDKCPLCAEGSEAIKPGSRGNG
jgi:orotate phosphoribosyltransferase